MSRSITVFKNEEAGRLFDYFISYKRIVSKEEKLPEQQDVKPKR